MLIGTVRPALVARAVEEIVSTGWTATATGSERICPPAIEARSFVATSGLTVAPNVPSAALVTVFSGCQLVSPLSRCSISTAVPGLLETPLSVTDRP